ncbi:MAG: Extracellular ligand-binding receptor, partial [Chloroflexi bacterium]|nr:Extracellular ligand-binding receptor [Chloroflexota bacterium]
EAANELGVPQIVIGAAADAIFDHGLRHVYQVYAPATVYLNGVVDMLRAADPTATRVAFLYRNDLFANDVVKHARDYAAGQGMEIVYDQPYDPSAVEFWDYLPGLAEAGAHLIMAGGLYPDSLALVTQMAYVGVPSRMLVLLVAPTQPSFGEIGDAAIGVLSPTDWEPLAPYSPEAAASDGLAFYGPTGAVFVRDFRSAYGYAPSYLAAGGYVAGLLLERSIEQAGSTQREEVERALASTDVATLFGPIRFASGGLQIAHSMSYVQWQPGPNGPQRQVIAPTSIATAPLLYPRP